jgi:hypothetical protein
LISRIVFVEGYGSWSSSLYSLLCHSVSAFREKRDKYKNSGVILSVLTANDPVCCTFIKFRRVATLTVRVLLISKQCDAQPRGWHVVSTVKILQPSQLLHRNISLCQSL